MIDKSNGSITLEDEKVVLKPGMTAADFKMTTLYDSGEIEPSYTLNKSHNIYNKRFFITVYFSDGYLKEIHLSEEVIGMSWADWTEENELKKKKKHDEWLQSFLGKAPYSYSWGYIESVFDRKSCISSIIIRYNCR